VAKRLASVPVRNGACARFVLLSPRSFPTGQSHRWSFQSHKLMGSKTSRLHEKSYPSDHEEQNLPRCQQYARKQLARMVGAFHAREEYGGKSDSRVRFLAKECARDVGGRCLSAFSPIIPSSLRENKADRNYVLYDNGTNPGTVFTIGISM
jgi:hypothetical protein